MILQPFPYKGTASTLSYTGVFVESEVLETSRPMCKTGIFPLKLRPLAPRRIIEILLCE